MPSYPSPIDLFDSAHLDLAGHPSYYSAVKIIEDLSNSRPGNVQGVLSDLHALCIISLIFGQEPHVNGLENTSDGFLRRFLEALKTSDAPWDQVLRSASRRSWNQVADYSKYTCHKCALKYLR